jgi:hypothetical protein
VLVNNAGILRAGPIETLPLEDFEAVVRVNQGRLLPRHAGGDPGDARCGRRLDREHLLDRRDACPAFEVAREEHLAKLPIPRIGVPADVASLAA